MNSIICKLIIIYVHMQYIIDCKKIDVYAERRFVGIYYYIIGKGIIGNVLSKIIIR